MLNAPAKPYLNGPATICCGSDRNPGTVVYVSPDGKRARVRYDEWQIIKGSEMDGSAEYVYRSNDGGADVDFRFNPRKNKWERVVMGENARWRKGFGSAYFGSRQRYYDPHF